MVQFVQACPTLRLVGLRMVQTPAPPNVWDECWATDGARQGDSYFLYLSIGPNQGRWALSHAHTTTPPPPPHQRAPRSLSLLLHTNPRV